MDFRRLYYDTEITNKGICFSQPRENHSWVQQFKILKYSTEENEHIFNKHKQGSKHQFKFNNRTLVKKKKSTVKARK